MKIHRSLAACLLLLALAAAAGAADDTYTVKLHRAFKVGDHYDTHIVIENTRNVTINNGGAAPRVEKQSTSGDLVGRVEVTDIDKTGTAVGLVLTVKKLVDGSGKELLPPGKEVVIKRGPNETSFAFTDGDLNADAKSMLANMFSKHKPESPTDDDIFGSADPHKPGEEWKMNAAKAAENLTMSGTPVAASDLAGKVILKGPEAAGGVPAVRVTGTMEAKNVKPPDAGNGSQVTACAMQVTFSGLYPTDPALPVADCKTEVDMQMSMLMTGSPVNYEIKAHVVNSETITPVKKAEK
jgi:hypothetical protein